MTQFPHETIQTIKEQLTLALSRTKGKKGDFRATFGVDNGEAFARFELLILIPEKDPEIITNLPAVKKLLLSLLPKDEQGHYQNLSEPFRLHFPVEKSKGKTEKPGPIVRTSEMKDPVEVFSSGVQIRAVEKQRQEFYKSWSGSEQTTIQSTKKYGSELASRFATRLMSVGFYGNSHRDYCGMGFIVKDGKILYAHLWDGELVKSEDVVKTFSDQDAFVRWLAAQSDQSLSLQNHKVEFYRNNQTITLFGLMSYLGV